MRPLVYTGDGGGVRRGSGGVPRVREACGSPDTAGRGQRITAARRQ